MSRDAEPLGSVLGHVERTEGGDEACFNAAAARITVRDAVSAPAQPNRQATPAIRGETPDLEGLRCDINDLIKGITDAKKV